ncbi:MAG: hypothetical protein KGR26_14265 [Cyanobacteria bacterium REEB65]|nr:hypothetical protein [Cyanobacteria bacterium REEB65]
MLPERHFDSAIIAPALWALPLADSTLTYNADGTVNKEILTGSRNGASVSEEHDYTYNADGTVATETVTRALDGSTGVQSTETFNYSGGSYTGSSVSITTFGG